MKFGIFFIKYSFVKYVWACAHEHTRTSKKIHDFEMVFQLHLLPVNIIFEIIIKNYSCKFLSNGNWKESRIAKRKNHQKFTRYKNYPQLSHIISVIIIQNNIYFQLFIIMLYEMIFAYWNGREQQTDIKIEHTAFIHPMHLPTVHAYERAHERENAKDIDRPRMKAGARARAHDIVYLFSGNWINAFCAYILYIRSNNCN